MLKKEEDARLCRWFSAYLSSLLTQDNHDGFIVTFWDDCFKHVLLHIWQEHTLVTSWSLHRGLFNIIKYGESKNMRDWAAPATHHLQFVPLQFDTRKKLAWGRLPPTSMGIKRFFTKASRRDNSKNKADGETDIASHCSVSWYFSTFEL